jgi:pyruvate ferredoxin oxidoreductase delta subunit
MAFVETVPKPMSNVGRGDERMAGGSIDVTYRGIFQKSLAGTITKQITKAAVQYDNRLGGTVSRYGDSPERNGIPAKQFSVIADSNTELQTEMTRYEPENVRVIAVMDDTLAKGVESWAWYGVQPININLKPGGTVLFISRRRPEEFLKIVPRKPFDWNIAVLEGEPSFAGLWVYNNDGTDYRTMGAIARIAPDLVRLESLQHLVEGEPNASQKLAWLKEGYERVVIRPVKAGEGVEDTYVPMELPGWTEMREGVAIPAIEPGKNNELFKKYTTRTARPIVDFDACIKCKICFIECPDEIFSLTDQGHYRVNYEHCCGCGLCAEVCPVDNCIRMVNELVFENNDDLYALYERDPAAYKAFIEQKVAEAGGPIPHYGIY